MKPYTYTVTRSRRRRTVAIRIRPDGSIDIAAPALLADAEIARIAASRRGWVARKQQELRARSLPLREYAFVPGEEFLYLGRPLRLNTVDGKGRVERTEKELIVSIPAGLRGSERDDYAATLLRSHYIASARELLRRKTFAQAGTCRVEPVFVEVKSYRARWGCCFSDGRIYYSWNIIMAPERIVDYVVLHELCHLLEANHSPRFWAQVGRFMPDFRERRAWLRLNGSALRF